MRPVFRIALATALLATALLTPATFAAAAAENAPVSAILPPPTTLPKLRLSNIRWPYFSSTTGQPVCKVNIGKTLPATKRAGPFVMPAPGYEIRQVTIDIIPGDCTANDWADLAAILADMRRLTLREPLTLRMTDATGATTGAEWQAAAAPTPRPSPTTPGEKMLVFLTQDAAGHRAPLLLYRDAASGSLVLRPALPNPANFPPHTPINTTATTITTTPTTITTPATITTNNNTTHP